MDNSEMILGVVEPSKKFWEPWSWASLNFYSPKKYSKKFSKKHCRNWVTENVTKHFQDHGFQKFSERPTPPKIITEMLIRKFTKSLKPVAPRLTTQKIFGSRGPGLVDQKKYSNIFSKKHCWNWVTGKVIVKIQTCPGPRLPKFFWASNNVQNCSGTFN